MRCRTGVAPVSILRKPKQQVVRPLHGREQPLKRQSLKFETGAMPVLQNRSGLPRPTPHPQSLSSLRGEGGSIVHRLRLVHA